jgi:hypothetical protein
MIQRSFVLPVLDMSPHSRFNIKTLLADPRQVEAEVICIFNSPEVFPSLQSHGGSGLRRLCPARRILPGSVTTYFYCDITWREIIAYALEKP